MCAVAYLTRKTCIAFAYEPPESRSDVPRVRSISKERPPAVLDVTNCLYAKNRTSSQNAEVDALADAAFERFGAVHVLCNNAGVFVGGVSWELAIEDYQWLLGVNLMGVVHGVRSFVPRLIAQGGHAHVVNTASMAAFVSAPFCGLYAMSKQALRRTRGWFRREARP
jgi:NAD(P)-dependent dehydrogenase (short-subunit alcohol dehydrogenase family)